MLKPSKKIQNLEKKNQLRLIKRGNNSKSYISRNKLTNKDRNYYVHDNGSRPFKIVINDKEIKIYKATNANFDGNVKLKSHLWYKNYEYDKLILKFSNFKGYWYGFDSNPFDSENGNSLLIKINDHNYIFIGDVIRSFKTFDVIHDYISPIGNNDVPYPVAYGNKYVYFMIENEYVPVERLYSEPNLKNSEKIYREFYEVHSKKDYKKRMRSKLLAKRHDWKF